MAWQFGPFVLYFWSMERHSIVTEICDQADEFLAGVVKRDEARAGIAEWLTIHRGKLPPEEKKAIIGEAMAILEEEEFFDADAGAVDGDAGDIVSEDQ